jgi:hypothetical protein
VPIADLPATGGAQLIQKLFGRDQIGIAETLRKAVVDRLEAGDGVGRGADDLAGGRGSSQRATPKTMPFAGAPHRAPA